MITQIIKQPSIIGIATGNKATVQIPTTGTHHALYLRCLTSAGVALTRTQILADIGDIIIRLDGEVIMEADVQLFLDLQKYYGDANGAGNVDGIIPIYFTRPKLALYSERIVTTMGMYNVGSFACEVQVDAVAQLASIEVLSEVDASKRVLGQHQRINKHPQSFSTTGVQEISQLPKYGDDVAYCALHIGAGSGTFEKVTIKIGGNNLMEDIDPNINQVLLEKSGRTPQSGYFHADFARSNDLTSILPMKGVQDFRQLITWKTAAPTNYNIYSETIHGLNVISKN